MSAIKGGAEGQCMVSTCQRPGDAGLTLAVPKGDGYQEVEASICFSCAHLLEHLAREAMSDLRYTSLLKRMEERGR